MIKFQAFVRNMLGGHFASIEPGLALLAVAILISFDWFGLHTYGMLDYWLSGRVSPALRNTILSGPFVLMVALLALAARWAARQPLLIIERKSNPENQYEALILFLSPASQDEPKIAKDVQTPSSIAGSIADAAVRAQFQGPWRMPVESIAHQLTSLKHIVVIPSKTIAGRMGTNAVCEPFRLTVQPLLIAAGSTARIHRLEGYRWDEGVNMEDGIETEQAVHDAYSQLNNEGRIRDQRILLDITGGYGLCSSVGAAAAATRKCSFAWVNRNDYSLQVYRSVPTAEITS